MAVHLRTTHSPPCDSLRPGTVADVEQVAALWAAGWVDGHRGHVPIALELHRNIDDFLRLAERRVAHTTVADEAGLITGFAVVVDDELEQLYVAAMHRGRGVAELLIAHAEAAVAEHYPACWLAVVSGNARARRFYERCGWHDAGPLDYCAEIDGGHLRVPTRRYEKSLAS